MENIENDNDNYKRLMALYGLSDDKENLLIIKIPFWKNSNKSYLATNKFFIISKKLFLERN